MMMVMVVEVVVFCLFVFWSVVAREEKECLALMMCNRVLSRLQSCGGNRSHTDIQPLLSSWFVMMLSCQCQIFCVFLESSSWGSLSVSVLQLCRLVFLVSCCFLFLVEICLVSRRKLTVFPSLSFLGKSQSLDCKSLLWSNEAGKGWNDAYYSLMISLPSVKDIYTLGRREADIRFPPSPTSGSYNRFVVS